MTRFRTHILTTTVLAGVSLLASPAFAQDSAQSTVPDQNQATNPGAAPPAGPVEANPTPTVSATGAPVQQPGDIIVTGTRIPQPNLTSAAPVATVSNQDIKLTGAVDIEDVLSQLPSAASPMGKGMPNPSAGTAEIDLRYMGAKRTLTLVNGRRMTPGDPNQSSTGAGDVNLIPSALVKRVEVLTGGASSVYGADAVAGVVNFIMDTDFDGLRLDGQISGYQHNNDCPKIAFGQTVCDALDARINAGFVGYDYPKGSVWDGLHYAVTAAFGAGFDDGRGHVTAYFGYQKQKATLQGNRDYSACTLNAAVPGTSPGGTGTTCGGSSYSAEGNFQITTPTGTHSTFYHRGPNNTLVAGKTRYNYAPLNHWIRPDERYTAGLFANYEITPAIKPYLEFMFMDDQQFTQIAPSGNFGSTFTINCDNPYMTAATHDIVCAPGNLVSGFLGTFPQTANNGGPAGPPLTFTDGAGHTYNEAFFQILKRNVEGGPRQAHFSHTSYRGVIGTRGDLSNAFSYDAYYQYGRTNYTQVFRNDVSQTRLVRSVNVVNDPRVGSPTFGQPICRSVLDNTDPDCQPFNYFGSPSQDAVDYTSVYGVIQGHDSEQVADVNFTGKLGELGLATPWAADGFGINVGWEYRKESLELNPDQAFQSNDLTGQGSATLPVNGNFHVNELFAEAQLPIVEQGFIEELSFGLGYRKSWYKTQGGGVDAGVGNKYNTDTYKIEAQFAPIRDIRFRGSYNRASRAPNVLELFSPATIQNDGSIDLCAGKTIKATDYGCIYQFQNANGGGIANPVGFFTPKNPSTQYLGLTGGNPALTPEVATTKTVGVVLQPRFLPRFAFSVDYWNIDLKHAIQGPGSDAIMSDCVNNSTAGSIRPSCGLIHRDPGGSLWLVASGPGEGYIYNVPSNSARITTQGYDFNTSYSQRFGGLGNLSLSFLGTWVRKYVTDNGIAPPYDCAGYYGTTCSNNPSGSDNAIPKWRHKARATLQMPFGLGVSLAWRMVGAVRYESSSSDTALTNFPLNFNQRVKPQHYIDLALTYSLLDMVNLRAGINNIFDKDPPIIPSGLGSCPGRACAGNTYPGTWDFMGRYLYAGATVDFKHKAAVIAPPPVELPPPPPPAAPATITCPDGLVILANQACPALPPPPPPPAPAPERGL